MCTISNFIIDHLAALYILLAMLAVMDQFTWSGEFSVLWRKFRSFFLFHFFVGHLSGRGFFHVNGASMPLMQAFFIHSFIHSFILLTSQVISLSVLLSHPSSLIWHLFFLAILTLFSLNVLHSASLLPSAFFHFGGNRRRLGVACRFSRF